jgi:hypothetical protein
VGSKLAILGELSSRTYFMNTVCEHTYYSILARKVNGTHPFNAAIKGILVYSVKICQSLSYRDM